MTILPSSLLARALAGTLSPAEAAGLVQAAFEAYEFGGPEGLATALGEDPDTRLAVISFIRDSFPYQHAWLDLWEAEIALGGLNAPAAAPDHPPQDSGAEGITDAHDDLLILVPEVDGRRFVEWPDLEGRLGVSDARANEGLILLVVGPTEYVPVFQLTAGNAGVHSAVPPVNRVLRAAADPWGATGWWVQRSGRIAARPCDWLLDPERAADLESLALASVSPD